MDSLPLYEEHSCALGVVMMNYLDELNGREEPTAETSREQQKHLAQGWVANGDFLDSLRDALQLWDAVRSPFYGRSKLITPANMTAQVYAAVTTAGAEVTDRSMWDEADQWLSQRR